MKKKEFEQTFVVKRNNWARGGVNGTSRLLNRFNNMCCLGFVCNQLGIPKRDLKGVGSPLYLSDKWDIPYLINDYKNNAFGYDFLSYPAMNINDNPVISDKEREKKLKRLFNKHNLDIVFE